MAERKRKPKLIDPVKVGRKGGKMRAQNMTAAERSESARKAAAARWGKNAARKESK
jgi:hypothetical protein